MKRLLIPVFLPLMLVAQSGGPSCKGCAAGKLMLQCDYYVVRQGDVGKRHFCADYAKIVDIDGASAKAAWYWLLAGEPEKAFDAALRAYNQGQTFAAGYAAQALAVMGNADEAKKFLNKFLSAVRDRSYFEKEVATLEKLYPAKDLKILEVK